MNLPDIQINAYDDIWFLIIDDYYYLAKPAGSDEFQITSVLSYVENNTIPNIPPSIRVGDEVCITKLFNDQSILVKEKQIFLTEFLENNQFKIKGKFISGFVNPY